MKANKKVLDVIRGGYKLPFLQTPKLSIFSNNKSASENHGFVAESIQNLIKTGFVIEPLKFQQLLIHCL